MLPLVDDEIAGVAQKRQQKLVQHFQPESLPPTDAGEHGERRVNSSPALVFFFPIFFKFNFIVIPFNKASAPTPLNSNGPVKRAKR